MPEAVENYLDAETLDFYLSNRQILSIQFLTQEFKNKCDGIELLASRVPFTVEKVRSRAKKIFIFLLTSNKERAWIILFHGMTGRINQLQTTHSHIQFTMSPCWIGFNRWFVQNARRIGFCIGTFSNIIFEKHIKDMGPPIIGYDEPNFKAITAETFIENLQKSKKTIASALLDQRTICSGAGTYIVSEVLHRANIHPLTKCCNIENGRQLYDTFIVFLKEAYDNGGVSMRDWIRADDVTGNEQKLFQVYNKKVCDGRPVRQISIATRTIWTLFD